MDNLIIQVSGPDKSGKGHAISAIAKALTSLGAEVVVQCAETHNKPKLEKTEEELALRLKSCHITILESQTS
jgi:thymidylate kinase